MEPIRDEDEGQRRLKQVALCYIRVIIHTPYGISDILARLIVLEDESGVMDVHIIKLRPDVHEELRTATIGVNLLSPISLFFVDTKHLGPRCHQPNNKERTQAETKLRRSAVTTVGARGRIAARDKKELFGAAKKHFTTLYASNDGRGYWRVLGKHSAL